MNLLVLMYHRARPGAHGNPGDMLDAHFAHIARHYRNVLPGDYLADHQLNVCLTFDDAYFDFHAVVLPLLRKHGLRAVLSVPPGFIHEQVELDRAARLGADTLNAGAWPAPGGLCTWPELGELARSGHVRIAAHGYTHRALDLPTDEEMEIEAPQTVLSSRLGQPVDSFVFPYGRFTGDVLEHAKRHYRYIFRIGGALNYDWSDRMLYRVTADGMTDPAALFTPGRLLQYRIRALWNRLRGR